MPWGLTEMSLWQNIGDGHTRAPSYFAKDPGFGLIVAFSELENVSDIFSDSWKDSKPIIAWVFCCINSSNHPGMPISAPCHKNISVRSRKDKGILSGLIDINTAGAYNTDRRGMSPDKILSAPWYAANKCSGSQIMSAPWYAANKCSGFKCLWRSVERQGVTILCRRTLLCCAHSFTFYLILNSIYRQK